jgi:ribosome-associated protein
LSPHANASLSPVRNISRNLDLLSQVHHALKELKARDVREIDVRGKTGITDFMVIASGTSSRHVKSIADEVVKQAKLAGIAPLGVEGEGDAEWVLVDLGDVVVHVMMPRTREFYGLERLWTVGDREPSDDDAADADADIGTDGMAAPEPH